MDSATALISAATLLVTALTGFTVVLLQIRKVHTLVNSKFDRQIALTDRKTIRAQALELLLEQHGIPFPVDPTDTVPDNPAAELKAQREDQ